MRILLALLLCVAARAGTVSVSDSTFSTGWATSVVYTTAVGNSATGNHISTGGNLGDFYRVGHAYNGEMVAANVSSLVLNPALYGGFASLAYQYDYRRISTSWAPGQIATSFLIFQNSAYYYASVTDFAYANDTWQTKTMSGVSASQFSRTYVTTLPGPVGAPANPDFSATGAPITFGFYTANSTSFPIESTHGYDNYSVTATFPDGSVPEPGTAMLLAIGAAALFQIRRRGLYHRLKCNAERSSPRQAAL